MYKPRGNMALYVTVALIAAFTVIFCIVYSGAALGCLEIQFDYYFLYQYTADNAVSASSLSAASENYGAAGYILCYQQKYYITVACYYTEEEAQSVSFNLKSNGINCQILPISVTEKSISSRASENTKNLFLGNLNTLEQLGKIVYECACSLDSGTFDQSAASQTLTAVRAGLGGLLSANVDNCFTPFLEDLIESTDEILSDSYIYSRAARRLQIAIADCIISVDMS